MSVPRSRQRLISMMSAATRAAAATRRAPNRSFNNSVPMSAAEMTPVSRRAATSASGACVWAQSTMP